MFKAPSKFLSHRWVIWVLLLVSVGCVWKGGGQKSDFNQQYIGGHVWKIGPVRMRVYPSTRFIEGKDDAMLEARVELFDEMGDAVKGVGEFRIELFDRLRELFVKRAHIAA